MSSIQGEPPVGRRREVPLTTDNFSSFAAIVFFACSDELWIAG